MNILKKMHLLCSTEDRKSYLEMNNDGIFISGWNISLKTYKIFETTFSLDFSCFIPENEKNECIIQRKVHFQRLDRLKDIDGMQLVKGYLTFSCSLSLTHTSVLAVSTEHEWVHQSTDCIIKQVLIVPWITILQ